MKLLVFSVYDAAAEAYLNPIFFRTKGEAIRTFSDAANAEDHDFRRHAGDYTLFHIGFFHVDSGLMEPLPTPDSLGLALQFIERLEVAS